jgi:hypothetical protein
MTKMKAYSLAAMLGLFSSNLFAEGSAYQVELIVFLQAMPNTEVFDQTDSRINWPATLTELSAYKKADNMTLNEGYAALSKDSTYRPILHAAWIQPAGEESLSVPVHIHSTDGKLNGYLQMQYEQNMQMTVDLEYASNQSDSSGNAIIYRLNEKRLIKKNEVNYLDHPKFGVIAKISAL